MQADMIRSQITKYEEALSTAQLEVIEYTRRIKELHNELTKLED